MLMYHISHQPPKPVPCRGRAHPSLWEEINGRKVWVRYTRNGTRLEMESGVFLTPDWKKIASRHNITGNLYIIEVPIDVVRDCGGILRTHGAPELLVPTRLWHRCRIVGKRDMHVVVAEWKRQQHGHRKHRQRVGLID